MARLAVSIILARINGGISELRYPWCVSSSLRAEDIILPDTVRCSIQMAGMERAVSLNGRVNRAAYSLVQ